jgi:Domain of unknown function (DUF397)
MEDNIKPGWRTSSYTGNGGGNCVEVADQPARVLVRDTKDRTGPALRFSPDAWRAFIAQLKRSLTTERIGISAAIRGRSFHNERPLRRTKGEFRAESVTPCNIMIAVSVFFAGVSVPAPLSLCSTDRSVCRKTPPSRVSGVDAIPG